MIIKGKMAPLFKSGAVFPKKVPWWSHFDSIFFSAASVHDAVDQLWAGLPPGEHVKYHTRHDYLLAKPTGFYLSPVSGQSPKYRHK